MVLRSNGNSNLITVGDVVVNKEEGTLDMIYPALLARDALGFFSIVSFTLSSCKISASTRAWLLLSSDANVLRSIAASLSRRILASELEKITALRLCMILRRAIRRLPDGIDIGARLSKVEDEAIGV
mmetsp:Transcript_8992/g.17591  ORF Transcript_8992/g.17591 Transcript_8992/m.17591 type:complete len:127 (-) Transcript_8992:79-459(-)|eukprot:CAMPEP_0170173266 /NCGR_PEP_ID=MMETSP0040_2-20121228/6535_1 /TAXON_ID=641309 /ORGANISM="Lotharella oceanica, Strain CCMP622" /LENGTH=126 /DNA_ID=CAMNT_0010414359 /DNA_START=393 /DNA_END=773 /DNA_ORIENTATION=-